MRRSIARVITVLAVLVGLAVACGDDEEASGDIEATASDFQFDPDTWSVTAGEEFTIDFTNDGSVEHEWAVLTEPIESEDDFAEDIVLLEVEAIPAGESATEAFTIDEAGTYQVICALETHFDAGMEGELTVE